MLKEKLEGLKSSGCYATEVAAASWDFNSHEELEAKFKTITLFPGIDNNPREWDEDLYSPSNGLVQLFSAGTTPAHNISFTHEGQSFVGEAVDMYVHIHGLHELQIFWTLYKVQKECSYCGGTGEVGPFEECYCCDGSGRI